MSIEFLTLSEVIYIHENQIEQYGGDSGVRDYNLLKSAIAVPEATFDGDYLHEDIFAMASAYAFHLCQNHPFVDGNKRAALASALLFLDTNEINIEEIGNYDSNELLYEAITNITAGNISKEELANIFRKLFL